MASRSTSRIGARLVFLLMVAAVAAMAGTINISTGPGGATWYVTNVSGTAYAYGQYAAANPGGTDISPSTTGRNTGTMVTGTSVNSFDGFWMATLQIPALPVGATNAVLTFSGLSADDRAILIVNGGATAVGNTAWALGTGVFYQTDGVSSPFTFTGTSIPATAAGNSGSIALGVGVNTLTLIVNNTNIAGSAGIGSPDAGFQNSGDGTTVTIAGNITYTDPGGSVPEPASITYLLIGAVPLSIRFAKRRAAR